MKPETELQVFEKLGGTFVTPIHTLVERARTIRGLVADWDGVFNQGAKGEGASSTYSEPDSMGTNLLRYALWREHRELPIAALITGAENPSARHFALRVQDRVIRLEMRLRLAQLLPADLRPRINELTPKQLVALRFASDEELPDLVRTVLVDRITDGRAIKKMIRNWQGDYLRA